MGTKTRVFNWIRKSLTSYPFEVFIRKFTVGSRSRSFIGRLVPNYYQYNINSIRKFKYNGINLSVDISDYIGHYLYFGFKDNSNENLINLISQGNTIIDIGTNIGATALQLALCTGSTGFVYGFEPDPVNYSSCIENIKLNNISNVLVGNIGLGDQDATLNMVVQTPLNRGGNRIKSKSDNDEVEQKLVKVTALDNWVDKNKNISKIDLIKIDVEGYEMKVLQGARQTIKTFKPTLFIELDDNNLREQNSSAKELIGVLLNFGYNNILHSISKEPIDLNYRFKDCHFDIIVK